LGSLDHGCVDDHGACGVLDWPQMGWIDLVLV
jgi:hypothetical protein